MFDVQVQPQGSRDRLPSSPKTRTEVNAVRGLDTHHPTPNHTRTPPPQVIAVCKSADLLLMVLDATKPLYHKQVC